MTALARIPEITDLLLKFTRPWSVGERGETLLRRLFAEANLRTHTGAQIARSSLVTRPISIIAAEILDPVRRSSMQVVGCKYLLSPLDAVAAWVLAIALQKGQLRSDLVLQRRELFAYADGTRYRK